MNKPSLEKFIDSVKPGGTLLYNSDLLDYPDPRTDITVLPIPCHSTALELGSDKVSNIVVLGALVEATDLVSKDACLETIKEKLGKRKPQFLSMNLQAYEKGQEIARKILES
jgi:2-oxoglutarate ferredoxin oxidoreductase subunit gamma